jgi:uncharacterized protein
MTNHLESAATVLGEDDCWQLLARSEVGRLAVSKHNVPEIFPVNFVIDNRTILFRTAEGTKMAALAGSGRVAFEIDGFDAPTGQAWSVVVHGTAERVERLNDVFATHELPLFPWDSAPKPVFVRIDPLRVTGRRFVADRGVRER